MSEKGTPERLIEDRRVRTGQLLEKEQRGTLTRAEARELVELKAIAKREAASLETTPPDEEAAREAENIAQAAGTGVLGALKGFFMGLLGLK